jgi:hypothetical protein
MIRSILGETIENYFSHITKMFSELGLDFSVTPRIRQVLKGYKRFDATRLRIPKFTVSVTWLLTWEPYFALNTPQAATSLWMILWTMVLGFMRMTEATVER